MLSCPMCKKALARLDRLCPTCRTDLSLLVDYADHLGDGLARADALTRAGELGEAVWAYLSVLEVDPDNPAARRQVGQVAAAVRQFDRVAPGRRWLLRLGRQARFRGWVNSWGSGGAAAGRLAVLLFALLLLAALAFGYALGRHAALYGRPDEAPPGKEAPASGGLKNPSFSS